jgi:hypothetical protein
VPGVVGGNNRPDGCGGETGRSIGASRPIVYRGGMSSSLPLPRLLSLDGAFTSGGGHRRWLQAPSVDLFPVEALHLARYDNIDELESSKVRPERYRGATTGEP